MTPTLSIDNLSISFNGKNLLRDFSFAVESGEHVALNGPSGCGKTTLLRCVLGFATPDKGSIQINGRLLDAKSVWELRRNVAYVPQQPMFGEGTVEDALKRPFAFKINTSKTANLSRAPELLKRLRLPEDIVKQKTGELSGGEKQRLALTMALLLERDILLLDEPTAALDSEAKTATIDLLHEQKKMTILSVSHDAPLHAAATRVVDIPANKET